MRKNNFLSKNEMTQLYLKIIQNKLLVQLNKLGIEEAYKSMIQIPKIQKSGVY